MKSKIFLFSLICICILLISGCGNSKKENIKNDSSLLSSAASSETDIQKSKVSQQKSKVVKEFSVESKENLFSSNSSEPFVEVSDNQNESIFEVPQDESSIVNEVEVEIEIPIESTNDYQESEVTEIPPSSIYSVAESDVQESPQPIVESSSIEEIESSIMIESSIDNEISEESFEESFEESSEESIEFIPQTWGMVINFCTTEDGYSIDRGTYVRVAAADEENPQKIIIDWYDTTTKINLSDVEVFTINDEKDLEVILMRRTAGVITN